MSLSDSKNKKKEKEVIQEKERASTIRKVTKKESQDPKEGKTRTAKEKASTTRRVTARPMVRTPTKAARIKREKTKKAKVNLQIHLCQGKG